MIPLPETSHHVGRNYNVMQQNYQEKAELLLKIKNLIISKELAPSQVKNADQSGFDKLNQSQSTLRYRVVPSKFMQL